MPNKIVKGETKKSANTIGNAIASIREYILERRLEPGAALPREIERAAELGISRNILREAMRHYRTLGIIESRPRVGAVVVRLLPEDPYAGYLPFLAARREAVKELGEVRAAIEDGIAPLIAERATPEDVRELEAICGDLERAEDMAHFRAADIEFHRRLWRIPGNWLLEGLIPLLVEFFQTAKRSGTAPGYFAGNRGRILDEHRRLAACLASGDRDEFVRQLRRHGEI